MMHSSMSKVGVQKKWFIGAIVLQLCVVLIGVLTVTDYGMTWEALSI